MNNHIKQIIIDTDEDMGITFVDHLGNITKHPMTKSTHPGAVIPAMEYDLRAEAISNMLTTSLNHNHTGAIVTFNKEDGTFEGHLLGLGIEGGEFSGDTAKSLIDNFIKAAENIEYLHKDPTEPQIG